MSKHVNPKRPSPSPHVIQDDRCEPPAPVDSGAPPHATGSRELGSRLAAEWARLGVGFAVAPADGVPDLERLIVETVRAGRAHARLLVMAAAWLRRHGSWVARHRLAQMAMTMLGDSERAVLGWLLDEACRPADAVPARVTNAEGTGGAFAGPVSIGGSGFAEVCGPAATAATSSRDTSGPGQRNADHAIPRARRSMTDAPRGFREVRAVCRPAARLQPVFRVHDRHPALLGRLSAQQSAAARRWNLLAEPIEHKPDALRSREWICASNPALAVRSLLDGDLRASILAVLSHDASAGGSELELARRCCASRAAVREALLRLEHAGLVRRSHAGRRREISLCGDLAALHAPVEDGASARTGRTLTARTKTA